MRPTSSASCWSARIRSSSLSDICQRRKTCRLCGSEKLLLVFQLAPTPPANAFVAKDKLAAAQPCFPLDVFFCEDCAHVQLLDVVDPETLFKDYVYVSGTSPVFVNHFKDYANDLLRQIQPPAASLVLDIGSNDGTLLKFFKERGMRVLGIDPAREIARRATADGIETIADFFTPDLALRIRREKGQAAIITANNVFAHIDDLLSVTAGVRQLLSKDGVFSFEVSYLLDVYEQTLFDMTYHEHLAYHSVKPLCRFFAANGMKMVEARRTSAHGGSLRGVVQLQGAVRKAGSSVAEMIALEEAAKLDRAETFIAFGAKINQKKQELGSLLRRLKKEGKTIAGFGAPAKATTLMHHFQLGPDIIDFIVDDNPLKQGLFSPGFHIPILPTSAIYERKPDYLLILAWNFAKSIIEKHHSFATGGGRFITPLPQIGIY